MIIVDEEDGTLWVGHASDSRDRAAEARANAGKITADIVILKRTGTADKRDDAGRNSYV
jgi:hypothetical protein